jgi:ABC-type nitrate/sulfonate/bicarbonate transport system ATPase subunit
MKVFSVKNLTKSFGELKVLENLSFDVNRGDFFSIIGPSGCGKTTLLNIIVGTLSNTSGQIILKDEDITGKITGKFGYMLQKDLLLPWRTLFDNLKLVTEVSGNVDNVDSIVNEYIEKVKLRGFEKFYPYQLSGGMMKRAALARMLMYCKIHNVDVMLMDEPFSNLDAITKRYLQSDLKRILVKERKTVIFVTHDIDEALFLSDRIAILSKRPAKIKKIFVINKPISKSSSNGKLSNSKPDKEKLREKIINKLKSEVDITV